MEALKGCRCVMLVILLSLTVLSMLSKKMVQRYPKYFKGRALLSFPEAWPEAPPWHGALLKKPFPVPARRVGALGKAAMLRFPEPFRAPEALDLHKGLMMLDAEARKAWVWSRFHRKISSNSDILL